MKEKHQPSALQRRPFLTTISSSNPIAFVFGRIAMSTNRKTVLGVGALLVGGVVTGWLVFQSARAEDDKKEPPKKADASEEKNLKDALEHLRQVRDIVEK